MFSQGFVGELGSWPWAGPPEGWWAGNPELLQGGDHPAQAGLRHVLRCREGFD